MLLALRRPGRGRRADQPARHARADATHDLVADGAEVAGPLLGRDPLVVLAPDQHDLVTAPHVVVAAVDHQLVHRDAADDAAPAAADQHVTDVAQPAAHAVGV